MPPEIDLGVIRRGSVTAPAGCGKTQLIADSLAEHNESKPVLILTHTNSGVGALKIRLQKAGVPATSVTVSTIDAFCIRLISRFPARSGHDPKILELATPKADYPAIRAAAVMLIHAGHLDGIFAASYARLIVDEYQDCDLQQHAVVDGMAATLHTCVLGDPMQAIFNFAGPVVHWDADVLPRFPSAGQLATPWRWRKAGSEQLGKWLLEARQALASGVPIDLRTAPKEVEWVRVSATDGIQKRMSAALTRPVSKDGDVLIIGKSANRAQRHDIASKTPGATVVEAVDIETLTQFGGRFTPTMGNAVAQLMSFASELMTGVGAAILLKRLETLKAGRARTPATIAEQAALTLESIPTWTAAEALLMALTEQEGARVYRPEIYYCCLSAMKAAAVGDSTFEEATKQMRERNRQLGRRISRRAVGSTLLLKGLESEVCVILHPEEMNACNLYVALTRGAKKIVICSDSHILYAR
jgi:DNA helicase-2/ATP-dependent DNA helicase PcrA